MAVAMGYNDIKSISTAVVCDCKYNYIPLGFLNLLCTSLLHSTCLPTCVYRWLLLLFEVHGVVANKSEWRVNSRGMRNRAMATLILSARTLTMLLVIYRRFSLYACLCSLYMYKPVDWNVHVTVYMHTVAECGCRI